MQIETAESNILVTGGAGYIGSHTANALHKSGYKPVVLDDLSTGHAWAVKWGPLVQGNCGDTALVRTVLRDYKIQAVMHFAASAEVGESTKNPEKYFNNNVVNSLGLLRAVLQEGIPHIVFSSTCATYGDPEYLPISETHPQRPINPYGDSKLFIERALHWFGTAESLRWVALRYFNAAGAEPRANLREDHAPETHLIPLLIHNAIGRKSKFHIFGTDYPTPDGTAIRDFVHVNDLANAHVLALEYLRNGGTSQSLNLGTGVGYSVRQVISQVSEAAGFAIQTVDLPRRPGDPCSLIADPRRAKEILHWNPRQSDLQEIVSSALQSWNATQMSADARLAGQQAAASKSI